LGFNELQGTHNGEAIAEAVYSVLDRYNITEKLFCVTTDNASNNDTGVEQLSSLLFMNKCIEWDHEEHHVRCMNHIINIAVQAFLKKCKVLVIDNSRYDLDLEELEDEFNDDEMRDVQILMNNPVIQNEITEAVQSFENTMQKL
jgi:hypothetical protein